MNTLIGYALNSIILPTPEEAIIPQTISNLIPAHSQIILSWPYIDTYVLNELLVYRIPGTALLSVQVPNGNWVNNIVTNVRATGVPYGGLVGGSLLGGMVPGVSTPPSSVEENFPGNVLLYLVPTTDISLIVPDASAMYY